MMSTANGAAVATGTGSREDGTMAKATMLIEVTDQQIRTLQDAAGWASDYAQAAICDIALGGDGEDRRMDDAQRAIVARYLGHPSAARTECARVIADAQ